MKFPFRWRTNHQQLHEQLDPEADRRTIMETLITREFPVEFLLSAEIAQLRSFTIPNGARLLHRTGEFEKHSLKRLDDTRAILVEMGRHGFESPQAREVADHLNEIHGFYDIPNDEFLYTLSTFIFDVWLFIERYGWRQLTETEKQCLYYTYRDMGELMNIQDIPPSFDAFWEWRVAYERENQRFVPEIHQVAEGLFAGARQMVSPLLRPLLVPFVFSLEDQAFADSLGYRWPNPLVRATFLSAMWVRKKAARFVTLWDVLSFEELVLSNFQSYPNGYRITMLGPDKIIRQLEKRQAQSDSLTRVG